MEIASESSMAKMPSITDESLLLSSLGRYIKNKIKPTSAQASGHQWLLRNDNTLLLLDPFIIYPRITTYVPVHSTSIHITPIMAVAYFATSTLMPA